MVSSKKSCPISKDSVGAKQTGQRSKSALIMLILALLTSPLFCCGSSYVLSALPGFDFGLFEIEARVENRSGETLYITPITTTYGYPRIITQDAFIRQRNLPIRPNQSIVLTYDAADMPLSGIVVCRESGECRLLENDRDVIYVDSFTHLFDLDPDWLQAVHSARPYNFGIVLYPLLGLVPVILFLNWLYLVTRGKKQHTGYENNG